MHVSRSCAYIQGSARFLADPRLARSKLRSTGRGAPWLRRGFTVVEILIVAVLFALSAAMAAELYWRSVSVERRLGVKIDLLHHAQVASLQISRALRQASEIVSPPEDAAETRPYVIYINEANELMVIYVNEKSQLVRQNRTKNDEVEVLGTGMARLRVHRKGHRLVNYHLFLEDKMAKEKFNLVSGVCVRNSIQ